MIVKMGAIEYDCLRAVRTKDRATLYLTPTPEEPDGGTTELVGVSDWSKITIEGGAGEQAAPDWREDMEAMAVDQEYRITLLELGLGEEV